MAEEKQAADSGVSQETDTVDEYIRVALQKARLKPGDETYGETVEGLKMLFREMLAPEKKADRVNKAVVDQLIAEIDEQLSAQVNEVLHHPAVQQLESTWRGLKLMVDRIDFRQNVQLKILSVSKKDLLQDFMDQPDALRSGMYKKVYSAEYDQYGGSPYGMIVADYQFDKDQKDMELLKRCGEVAAMAHAPFLTNADSGFFGCDDYTELADKGDLKTLFGGKAYAKWRALRENENARYIGLCGPRCLLRSPYEGDSGRDELFNFQEDVIDKHANYLWGGSAFALATRVADSFAKFRWGPNIIGPKAGGSVDDLPLHPYVAAGEEVMKVPTEVLITGERQQELDELGFIPLVYKKDSDNAAFFSAASAQKPKKFPNTPEGQAAETNYRLGTQLPYMFVITRLAHYLKVLQRAEIGTWKERVDVERGLNEWLSQYVAEMDNPSEKVRSTKPLREAKVTVEEVPGQAGWYRCNLQVRPHFKFAGADFTLSLVGKLDKD